MGCADDTVEYSLNDPEGVRTVEHDENWQNPPRPEAVFLDLVKAAQPNRIIEFGSWEGRSAVAFHLASLQEGIDLRLLCVDTWLGSPEHWDARTEGEWSQSHLGIDDLGEPRVIETFRENISSWGFSEKTMTLRTPTANCVPWIVRNFPNADLVYVDADHAYAQVLNDLKIAKQVAPGALVCGDDWEWVRKAVVRFAIFRRQGILLDKRGKTWALMDANQMRMRAGLVERGWREISPLIEVLRMVAKRLTVR